MQLPCCFFHDADMPKISRIQIIEPVMALPDMPPTLDADLEWVKKRGVDVDRQHHDSVSTVSLSHSHPLPQVFVDGNMALSGRYPTREEMGIWMMFGFVSPNDTGSSGPRPCTL